ncbi:MBL fold metallo-hydrolase [Teredinibacter turnerae]|uniref:MBL fold metallo-hydrolase n=1 Tax=Teredinibacter turnerae TaxID=2426 RepID=UPI0003A98E74|nr:MBL fold metallo-hydrolase [Teredinibacter turnerae]
MKIRFVGGVDHITGSCSWLYHSECNFHVLVDCGMIQGNGVEHMNGKPFPFDPKKINVVFLTHAHLDHCGLIPKLYRDGFNGEVITTKATAELAKITLLDSVHIMGECGFFSKADVGRIRFRCVDENVGFHWGKLNTLTPGITYSFLLSSHILGASSISISWAVDPADTNKDNWKTMAFSGDIGNNVESNCYLPFLKGNKYPFPSTDYMLVESTYGAKVRNDDYKSERGRRDSLRKILKKTLNNKKGKVLIPAFSIHRAQEIYIDILSIYLDGETDVAMLKNDDHSFLKVLFVSKTMFDAFNVFDSVLSDTLADGKYKYVSEDFLAFRKDLAENALGEMSIFGKKIFSGKNLERRKLDVKLEAGTISFSITPSLPEKKKTFDIIVASSGMCVGGPALQILDEIKSNPANSIVITGYQAPGTQGSDLLRRIDSQSEVDDRAFVYNMSPYYSGHADQSILVDYIFNLAGRSNEARHAKVFLNHGDPDSKQKLRKRIEDEASRNLPDRRKIDAVIIAGVGEWYDLNVGEYMDIDPIVQDVELADVYDELVQIRKLLSKLVEAQEK